MFVNASDRPACLWTVAVPPRMGPNFVVADARGRALPSVRWKLSFIVPCQEGNAVRETSQTL